MSRLFFSTEGRAMGDDDIDYHMPQDIETDLVERGMYEDIFGTRDDDDDGDDDDELE